MAFDFQFTTNIKAQEAALREEAEKRLTKLGLQRDDIVGAIVNVKDDAHAETPHSFKAVVEIDMKPRRIAATKKGDNPGTALREALDAAEKQVRKLRDKMRDY